MLLVLSELICMQKPVETLHNHTDALYRHLPGCCCCCSFGQGSSLPWAHTLRPFYNRPIVLTQEGRSLVTDVCVCVTEG